MLTGHPPWHQCGIYEAITKIATLKTADYQLSSTISDEAQEFLDKAFIPDDKQRPNCGELLTHKWFVTKPTQGKFIITQILYNVWSLVIILFLNFS